MANYIEANKPQPTKASKKIGRNEKCHCGSQNKYKSCCL
ncbi:SEC-C metal-binding domain-containing protein [Sulfurimonas gotlandica]